MKKTYTTAVACSTALILILGFSIPALSQDLVSLARPQPAPVQPAPAVSAARPSVLFQEPYHKFWDRENRILFAGVAASSTADFAVTYSNLQNGGKELNPITRVFSGSTAGLAFNFAGETAGVIGLSYFFHKTGHHKLERMVSVASIGASSFAVAYDLNHR